jgi:ElaB/YqjD/DUF883 family membrane-anchored ribosome-binding protein
MSHGNGSGDPEALRADIRRTREELGETVQALAAKADVKARVKESAAQTRERVRQRAGHTAAVVRESAHETGVAARRNPVPWAAVAAGAVAAVILIIVVRGRNR